MSDKAASYVQIQKQIAILQRQAEQLKQKEVAGVIERIKEAIQTYELTAADLGLVTIVRKQPNALASKKRSVRSGAKFRHPDGHEWGGRGPRPAWLREALLAGAELQDFAVS